MSTDEIFESAFNYLNTHNITLTNEEKLKLYGLFKQATEGDCNTKKPSLFEFVNRAKWDAWQSNHGMPVQVAREQYALYLESLKVGWSREGEYAFEEDGSREEQHGMGNMVSSMADGPEDEEDEDEDVFGYARRNQLDSMREWLKQDASRVNHKDHDGLTALHYASDRGHVEMVKLLLDSGADVNAKTNDSETPLHYACISEHLSIAQLLIDNGCDITAQDQDGQTALDHAPTDFQSQLVLPQ